MSDVFNCLEKKKDSSSLSADVTIFSLRAFLANRDKEGDL